MKIDISETAFLIGEFQAASGKDAELNYVNNAKDIFIVDLKIKSGIYHDKLLVPEKVRNHFDIIAIKIYSVHWFSNCAKVGIYLKRKEKE